MSNRFTASADQHSRKKIKLSYQAVEWAMKKAPMLLTDKGKPDTTARYVLAALGEHAKSDGTQARPSIATIRYYTGYDRRTVQRALRRLEEGGLIESVGTVRGCTNYTLAVSLVRPESDWVEIEADEQRFRDAAAERKRKSRAAPVTHSECVTVTHSDDVTDDSNEADVTHSAPGRHAFQMRDRTDVTHSDDVTSRDVTHSTPPEPPSEPPVRDEPPFEPSGADDVIPGLLCVVATEADAAKPRRAAKKKPSEPKPNKHGVADDLTKKFWEIHKSRCAQSFVVIRGIVRTAIGNGIARDDVARALDHVAREGMPVSGGTLQTALKAIDEARRPNLRAVAGGLTEDQWAKAARRAQERDAREAAARNQEHT